MKKYLIALVLACTSSLSAGWNSAATIPQGVSNGVYFDVSLEYFPKLKKVVAAWADPVTQLPYYAVYDGIADTWTTALQFSTVQVSRNVNLQSFPFKKIVVAAWVDFVHVAHSSYYDGANWFDLGPIGTEESFNSTVDVGLTYDKVNRRVIAAWPTGPAPQTPANVIPFYAILDTTLTWTAPGKLYPPMNVNVFDAINLAYDIANNQVVAAWQNSRDNLPVYSIFSGGTWTQPIAIPGALAILDDVRLTYDRMQGAVIAAWATIGGTTGYSAVYNGSWSAPTLLNLDGSSGIDENVSLKYNLGSGVVFTAWQDLENPPTATGQPFYSILNTVTAGPIPPGSSAGVDYNVNLAYDQHSGKMVAAWGNFNTSGPSIPTPYYNTYQ